VAAVPLESRIGDGRTIHLPSLVAEFGDDELDFRLYKVLAAHAAGITDIIIPERNRADLADIPEKVKDEVTFHPVLSIDEVLNLALEETPVEASVAM